jgi:hypothetical protein
MERGILYTLAVVLALALLILIISFGAVFALISFRNRRPGYFGSGMGSNCSHAAAIGEQS